MANQFLPFCDGPNPNVLSTSEWSANDSRSTGFKSGIAKSIDINTSIASGANIANAVAEFIALNLPNEDVIPTAATKLIEQYISALKTYIAANGALPIGALIPFIGTTVPKGYLICNGASLLRRDYPDLFNVIGTRFGAVDSAHFKIPSLHHQFIEATTTLSEVGTYVSAGLPNILGTFRLRTAALGDGSISKIGWASGAITDDDAETGTSSAISTDPVTATQLFNFSANRSNQVFGASGTVQPSAMRALVLIRAF